MKSFLIGAAIITHAAVLPSIIQWLAAPEPPHETCLQRCLLLHVDDSCAELCGAQ